MEYVIAAFNIAMLFILGCGFGHWVGKKQTINCHLEASLQSIKLAHDRVRRGLLDLGKAVAALETEKANQESKEQPK